MDNIIRKEQKVEIRIFGSTECHHCMEVKEEFKNMGIIVDFIDANADENQKLCDDHNVDKLPHTQAIRDGKVIMEHSGPYSAQQFLADVAYRITKGSQSFPVAKSQSSGCSGCKK